MENENFVVLKSNWKWIITIMISILAMVPAWLTYSQNKTKSLDIKINNVTPLLKNQIGISNDIVITVAGTAVEKPYSTVIEISNSGDVPIEKKDYEKPIEISVEKNVNILKTNILKTVPEGIEIEISFIQNKIIINPALLNPGDIVLIDVLTSNAEPSFHASGRIVGVKTISLTEIDVKKDTKISFVFFIFSGFLCLVGANTISTIKKFSVLNRKSSILVSMMLYGAGSFANLQIGIFLGFDKLWHFVSFYILMLFFSIPIGEFVNRSTSKVLVCDPQKGPVK